MREAGFRDVAVGDYFDPFLGTSKEKTARKYGVRGANFVAWR